MQTRHYMVHTPIGALTHLQKWTQTFTVQCTLKGDKYYSSLSDAVFIIHNTVEPLLKDTPNKGHNTFDLSIKDKFCGPYRIMAIQFYPEDNLSITGKLCQKLLVPKCPLFRGSTVYTIAT